MTRLARVLLIAFWACAGCGEPDPYVEPDAAEDAGMDAATPPFDPRGDQVSLYGDWNVNGQAPSERGCREAGLDKVQLVFIDPSTGAEYTDETFRFPCTLDFFETTPVRVLAAGRYDYQWRAYDGETLALQSRRFSATAAAGAEIELMRVDFQRRAPVSVQVRLTWEDAGDNASTCANAMVDAGYVYRLYRGASAANGVPVAGYESAGIVSCADALTINEFPAGTLPEGTYALEVSGFSTSSVEWLGTCVIQVPNGGPVATDCSVMRGTP